jgi:hypothetical protein
MDPQAVWTRLLDALEARDEAVAMEAAHDLLTWLTRNGFPPEIIPGRKLPEAWSRAVVRFACEFVWKHPGDWQA